MEYDIETIPDIKPIRLKLYSCPYKGIIYQEIETFRETDIIRPVKMSQLGFPTVLVNIPHSNRRSVLAATLLHNKLKVCILVRIIHRSAL